MADQATIDKVRSLFGYLATYLDDPEVGPILIQAADEGWDQARLQGALYATNWWKTRSEVQRQWDALAATDPAEADRQRQQKLYEINQYALQSGVRFSWERMLEIAEQSLREGWDSSRLKNATVMEGARSTTDLVGDIGSVTAQLRAKAADYMMKLTDDDLFHYAQQIAAGGTSMDGMTSLFQTMAKSRFPQMGSYIDQGITPGAFFQPYKSQIAQELEVAPDSIDFLNDPKWMQVVSYNDNGTIRPMTMTEATQLARRQPEYRKTAGGQSNAANLVEKIAETFGKVAV